MQHLANTFDGFYISHLSHL